MIRPVRLLHVTPMIGASSMPEGPGHHLDVYFVHYYQHSTPTPTTTTTSVHNADYRITAVDPYAATQAMDHHPFETGQSPANCRCKCRSNAGSRIRTSRWGSRYSQSFVLMEYVRDWLADCQIYRVRESCWPPLRAWSVLPEKAQQKSILQDLQILGHDGRTTYSPPIYSSILSSWAYRFNFGRDRGRRTFVSCPSQPCSLIFDWLSISVEMDRPNPPFTIPQLNLRGKVPGGVIVGIDTENDDALSIPAVILSVRGTTFTFWGTFY